jgi:hypothetical protein
MTSLRPIAAALTFALLLLAGCHVTENKNGKNDNVDISTPFGGMKVKTNDTVDAASIGITPYPGAVAYNDNDKDHNSAVVNLSFGDFHLGVKAATFKSTDPQDKILSFYRKDLARFGDVIECKGDSAVGQPTHTAQGLTCDEKQGNHISNDAASGSDLELRAGSEQHQHIVSVKPKDGFLKIGLVALDLPTHLEKHDDKDSE